MTEPIFVDTNVFLYAIDETDSAKQESAREWRRALWTTRRGRTSYQVLEEFYVNVAKKWPHARDQARAEVRDLLTWRPVVVNAEVLDTAWNVQDRFQLSFWDALIVAAARAASCRFLLTEDLQPDQDLDGIRVVNPFLRRPGFLIPQAES